MEKGRTLSILHTEASLGWGGQERRILLEAEGMRERGHTVILAVAPGGILIEKGRSKGFLVYEVDFRRFAWPVALGRLLQLIRRFQIDVVNTHSSLDSWIGGIAARIARRAVVRTRHLSTSVKGGLNSRILYGWLADYVVTTCASIIPQLAAQSRKPLSQFQSVATGVDPQAIQATEQDAATFRRDWGLADTDFVVGTVCVMRSWKGINDFLEAAALLRDEPNLRWVIVGGGHDARHRKRSFELALQDKVVFTGPLEPPYAAMKAFDLFALLSTANEGVSQSVLQAAFLGKPLLTTPVGGLPEVCLDGKTGVLVPVSSPEEIAKQVTRLKANPEFARGMGRLARDRVLTEFTRKHTLDAMERICTSLLERISNTNCEK
jgi:glycosyltransferase involved in cell wall biosynthesis